MNPFRFITTILGYLKQQPAIVAAATPAHTGANMLLLLAYLIWNNTKDKKRIRFRPKSSIYCTCSETTTTTTTSSNQNKVESSVGSTVERTPSPPALNIRREESPVRLALPATEPEQISRSYYYRMEEEDGDGPTMLQCQMVRIIDPPRRSYIHTRRQDSTYSTDNEQPKIIKKGKKNNKRLQKAYKGGRRNKRRNY